MLIGCDVATVSGEIQRRVRLTVFTVAIGKLANEVGSYLRFAQASRRLRHTEREDRRTCPVSANLSSGGKPLVTSKTFIASSYAFLYTSKSLAELIRIRDSDQTGLRNHDIRSS